MAMLADEPGLRTYVLRESGKRVAEWLKTQHDTMWEALPLKLAPPQERLQVYLTQYDDARWDLLMLKWPRWYEKLRRDFDRLKVRAQCGDWTEEDEGL